MVAISLAVGLTILICAGRPKKLSVLPEMGVLVARENYKSTSRLRGGAEQFYEQKEKLLFARLEIFNAVRRHLA